MNGLKRSSKEILALQLHYTSSRYGLSGHPGFQTRAMSSAIQPEEKRAIERLGIYQPPRDCPVEPTREQINELFPVAYRSTYLETGHLALVRSVYFGQDYTGRWGNYFSHALLFDQLPKTYWPVDLYEWEGWKSGLYKNEDIAQSSYELPAIRFLPDKSAFSFIELQQFLKEENGRQTVLGEMIQAVFLRKETARSLVIREEIEANGLFWIACLQKSFPTACQRDLGCSSYQFDPRACLEINVIHGETDFLLGENERTYQFYVFDFIDGIHSHVDDSYKEYALLISTWMHEYPERLEAFYTFADQFMLKEISNDLCLALRLYRLNIGDNLKLDDTDLIDILSFIHSSLKKEYFSKILDMISSSMGPMTKSQNPEYISQLALLFIDGVEQTGAPKFKTMVYELILKLVHNCIFEKGISINQLYSLRSKARLADKSFDHELSRLFLSDQYLSNLNTHVDKLDKEGMSLCLNELLSALRVDKDNAVYDERLRSYVEHIVGFVAPDLSAINWLFLPFENSIISQSQLCVYICDTLEQLVDSERITQAKYNSSINAFSLFLHNLFQSKGDAFRFEFINIVKNEALLWGLLEQEYRQGISKGDIDSIAFYNNYYLNALTDKSEFAKEFISVFAEILWDSILNKHKFMLAVEWMKKGHIKDFSDQLVSAVFHIVNEEISLNIKDSKSDTLSKLIDDRINSFNIALRPDRSLLRSAIIMAQNKQIQFDKQPINTIKSALSGSDRETFEQFINLYLPQIMMKVRSPEQHGLIIREVFFDRYHDLFLKSYQRFLDKGKANEFNAAEMAALKYWVLLTADSDDYNLVKNIHSKALHILAVRLARLKDSAYNTLMHSFTKNIDMTRPQHLTLREIQRQVKEVQDTFFGQVRRFISKDLKQLNLNWRSKR